MRELDDQFNCPFQAAIPDGKLRLLNLDHTTTFSDCMTKTSSFHILDKKKCNFSISVDVMHGVS